MDHFLLEITMWFNLCRNLSPNIPARWAKVWMSIGQIQASATVYLTQKGTLKKGFWCFPDPYCVVLCSQWSRCSYEGETWMTVGLHKNECFVVGTNWYLILTVNACTMQPSLEIVFRSPVGNWCKDWQLDWTATDRNWTAVASCPVCQKSKRPVVDRLQPVFLRTGRLAHEPPHSGAYTLFFSYFYLFIWIY